VVGALTVCLRGTGAIATITVVASVITRRVRVVIAVSVASFGASVSCAGGVSIRASGATVLIGPAEPVTALTIAGALTICLRGAVVVAAIGTSNDRRASTVGGFGFTAAIYFLGAGITVVSGVGPATGALTPSIGTTVIVASVGTSDLFGTGASRAGTQVTFVDGTGLIRAGGIRERDGDFLFSAEGADGTGVLDLDDERAVIEIASGYGICFA
jgi:hypothetical protein